MKEKTERVEDLIDRDDLLSYKSDAYVWAATLVLFDIEWLTDAGMNNSTT